MEKIKFFCCFVFKGHYQSIISRQCFENDSVFSVSAHAQGFNFTSSHSADKCQEERVKRSPQHSRYRPRQDRICAAGLMIT